MQHNALDFRPPRATSTITERPTSETFRPKFGWKASDVGRFWLLVVGVVLALAGNGWGQPAIDWYRTYGGDLNERCNAMIQTMDGGYALVGYTTSFGAGGTDLFIVKTDSFGEPEWSRSYGGRQNETACAIIELVDGTFVIAGSTGSFGPHWNDLWLIKVNSAGDSIWSHAYGTVYDDYCADMVLTEDGGFALAGQIVSIDHGANLNFYLVRVDENGDTLWTRSIGSAVQEFCMTMINNQQGGFVLAGGGHGGYGYQMLATDDRGDSLWYANFRRSGFEEIRSVEPMEDNGFILIGYSSGGGDVVPWIIRTDSIGNKSREWEFDGNGGNWALASARSRDGGIILVGDSDEGEYTANKIWMMKMNEDGDSAWAISYDEAFPATGRSVVEVADGSIVIAGATAERGDENQDFVLMKTMPSYSWISQNSFSPVGESLTPVFPNPTNGIAYVGISLSSSETVSIDLYDIAGRKVQNFGPRMHKQGNYKQELDLRELISGEYIVSIQIGESKSYRQKFILVK